MRSFYGVVLSKGSTIKRLLALSLLLCLLSSLIPIGTIQAQTPPPSALGKLDPVLAQALNGSDTLIWPDPGRGTVRVLVQTNGVISASLTSAIYQYGGQVVRRFSSINCLLAELPKSRVLDLASRSDVERMSPDHLAVQSASHLEIATGAD